MTPPKAEPAKDTIYIDVEDEITSIIDKVESSSKKIVALVLPKKSAALQSIVNMRLLKRSADEASKNLVLVTSDQKVLPLAGAAGVYVAKNLQTKPHIPPSPIPIKGKIPIVLADEADEALNEKDATLDQHRLAGELAVSEEVEEPETIDLPDDKTESEDTAAGAKKPDKKSLAGAIKDKRLKVPNFDKFRLRLILLAAGLLGLIIFFFIANKVLPKAEIFIKTTSTPLSATFNVNALDYAKEVNVEEGNIPSFLKSSDQTSTQQVTATGQENKGEKASGSVTMKATKCAPNIGQPSAVPAGTGVNTGGLTYITQSATTFSSSPSGGSGSCVDYNANNSTNIVAQAGGSKYNTASGATFTVSGRSDVSATGSASGGTDSNVTVVAQSDIDEAKKKITSQSSDEFSKEFQKKLDDEGYYLLAPTQKISEAVVTVSPEVGQPASTATVSIKITHSVVAVKEDDLKKVVEDRLKKQIDTSRQQILDSDLLKNLSLTISNQTSPTNLTLSIAAAANATPNIDTEDIKRKAGGLEKGAIQKLVQDIPGVKEVDAKMSPFWVSRAPKNPAKVKVNLEQVKETDAEQQ